MPQITVANLHKRLGKLVESGHGRKPVVVDKTSFTHSCEADGVTILPLSGLGVLWIPTADDDGGTKFNRDGSEAGRRCVVLVGDLRANVNGDIVP